MLWLKWYLIIALSNSVTFRRGLSSFSICLKLAREINEQLRPHTSLEKRIKAAPKCTVRLLVPKRGSQRSSYQFPCNEHPRAWERGKTFRNKYKFPGCNKSRHQVFKMSDVQAEREAFMEVRETDLNGDVISGAINATADIDLEENDQQKFPRMEEMLKVATDLQSDRIHQDATTENSPRLEFQNSPKDSLPSSNWETSPGYPGPQSGPGQNGHPESQQLVRPTTAPKLDTIKKWSISTYKCTRQYLSEKFGKGTRTVDAELESQIQLLRDTQLKYQHILKLSKQMNQHFHNMVQSQKSLADAFADLGMKSPELQDEFNYNSETQRSLAKNGEFLLGALTFFTSNLTTLVNKTMEDSITTAKAYEISRIEYDAYRADMEASQALPNRAEEAKMQFEQQQEKFNRLRGDLTIKLRFLEENKVKVMHKQLLLFHNAITAYFTGNKQALESCIKEFHIKVKCSKEAAPQSSFLEH